MKEERARVLRGSCLCGGIRYEVRSALGEMSHCHCSMCRKAHGAAFGTYAPVAWSDFHVIAGSGLLGSFRSSASVTRTFCTVCGSTLQWIRDGRERFALAVGTLDDDPGTRPVVQIWARDRAPWWELSEPPPAFETVPPREAD